MKLVKQSSVPLLVIALALGVFASPAATQTLRGKVVDQSTDAPIPGASVLLLDETGRVRKMAISDPSGGYSIDTPGPGDYSLRVDAPGYNTHNEPPFVMLAGRNLELNVRLWGYTELAPVTVTADSVPFAPGPLEGFYERKDQGRGEFVTMEEIELMGVNRFTDLLRMKPSVNIVSLGGTLYTIRIKGTGRIGRGCPPSLWVDNVRWGTVDLDGQGPDRQLYPSDIAGIEIYRPSSVPIDFSAFDTSCGVIVVWTKRAPDERR